MTPTAELSVDSQVPELLPPFRPLVIKYALIQALKKAKRFGPAMEVYSIYMNELSFATRDLLDMIPDSVADRTWA
jgi:hypothetical protein